MTAGRMTWANPVRTFNDDAPTIEERTHAPTAEACMAFTAWKAAVAAERTARAERRAADKDARAMAARLRARRKGQATKPVKAEPPPVVAPRPKASKVGQGARLNEEQARALHARWMTPDGPTLGALATEAGLSQSALRDTFKRHDLPTRNPRKPQLTEAQVRAIHARYLAGEKLETLGEEIGCKGNWLRHLCHRHGLEILNRSDPAKVKSLDAATIEAAITAHARGTQWRVIAAELGISRDTLRRLTSAAPPP